MEDEDEEEENICWPDKSYADDHVALERQDVNMDMEVVILFVDTASLLSLPQHKVHQPQPRAHVSQQVSVSLLRKEPRPPCEHAGHSSRPTCSRSSVPSEFMAAASHLLEGVSFSNYPRRTAES